MAQFVYKALKASAGGGGQVQSGVATHPDESAAREALREQGLIPLDIRPANPFLPLLQWSRHERLRGGDQAWFFQTMYTLMEARLPVEEAVATIEEIAPKPRLRAAAASVRAGLRSGHDLAESVTRVPGLCDDQIVAVLKVGMASGKLLHALALIDRSVRTRREIRRTVGSRLTYPAILLAGSILSVWFLSSFVIPRFAETLTTAGAELPASTRLTLAASTYAVWVVPVIAVAVGALFFAKPWRRMPGLAKRIDETTLRLPLFGNLRWHSQTVLVADTLATVVEGGGEVLLALHHASSAIKSPTLRDRLDRSARAFREGADLGDTLASHKVFPPMSAALVRIGMRSGGLVESLRSVVKTSLEQQQRITQQLLTLMEPATILLLSGLVGWIVYSLISGMLAVNELGAV